jgi:hypothetical protein
MVEMMRQMRNEIYKCKSKLGRFIVATKILVRQADAGALYVLNLRIR